MSRIIELAHPSPPGRGRPAWSANPIGRSLNQGREARARQGEAQREGEGLRFSSLRAMVLESVGPVRHEVSVPFHDSQVRGIALLIQTGWDKLWGTDAYWEPGPFLGEHVIFRMVRSGVRIVGVDFPVAERCEETRLFTGGKVAIV